MLDDMRRLHPRGAANKGICVDIDGAMLGPDCVLVGRTQHGFRALGREQASTLQKCVLDDGADKDWLFRQCQRISDALNQGEVALAQIHGLYIPVVKLNERMLHRLALISISKAGFNPDEPRIPRGEPHAGEWTTGELAQDSETQEMAALSVPSDRSKDKCIEYCWERTATMRDWSGNPFFACMRACQGYGAHPLFPEFD